MVSKKEYQIFFQPFDLEVLSAIQSYWLNIGHIHGENIYFNEISQYSLPVLNWHDQQTSPDLATAKTIFPGVVCGGLKQWDTLAYGDAKRVQAEAQAAILSTNGTQFILSTGCVIPIITPWGNIMEARKIVEAK
jgi:uroporphyrinogen decarboxylase